MCSEYDMFKCLEWLLRNKHSSNNVYDEWIIKNVIIVLFFSWGSMGKTELEGKGGLIKFANFIYL